MIDMCDASDETLLTTDEAVTKLGIPTAEIERLRGDATIQGLQASSRLHERLDAEFGPAPVLTDEELRILEDSRPGTLPWQRVDSEDRRDA